MAIFSTKAKLFVAGRKNVFSLLESALKDNNQPIVWFHCASLGEFEQGRPIMERFKEAYPEYKILLTFFSPSGYEVRKNYPGADYIFYLPWDSPKNAKRLVKLVQPKIAIFIKYEYWHFYIQELKDQHIPCISVSSIFRPDQVYFKSYGHFNLNILKNISYFFVQNRASKLILERHGIENVSVAGDTRFDRVARIAQSKIDLPAVAQFKGNKKIMVIGSCWPEDLDVLLPFINASDMKFIIAPHEIEDGFIAQIQKECIRNCILYSDLDQYSGHEDVLIINNMGLLSSLYAYGEYAYIGGAFGAGLHNILEAATYGVPIFFGNKNYRKFNEAVELINLGGAVAIGSYTELKNQFEVFADEKTLAIAGQVNQDYVKDNTGATEKVMEYCKSLLE